MADEYPYTLADVMRRYGVAHMTVWRWLKQGRIEGVKLRPKDDPLMRAIWHISAEQMEAIPELIEQQEARLRPGLVRHVREVRERKLTQQQEE